MLYIRRFFHIREGGGINLFPHSLWKMGIDELLLLKQCLCLILNNLCQFLNMQSFCRRILIPILWINEHITFALHQPFN